MQNIDEKKSRIPSVGMPNLNFLKPLALFFLILAVGMYIYLQVLAYHYDDTEVRSQILAVNNSVIDVNNTKANRNGTIFSLNQLNDEDSRINSRLNQINESIKDLKGKIPNDNSEEIRNIAARLNAIQEQINELKNQSIAHAENSTPIQLPAQQNTTQKSCKQNLLDKHGLGPAFDVVYCCETRSYGFADECCSCYK